MIRDPELARLADAVLIPPFPGHTPPRWILSALEGGLAGVTLFGPNVADPEQVAVLTAALREATGEPVIAIDEEGGDVTRVTYWSGSPYPGNAALGAVDDPDLTMRVHAAIGADLAALGINVDLAPCVDVLVTADNPAIGTRAFGADPALVSRHAAAAVTGLQSAGVAACAKHFPGHGSTRTDTHEAIATISGDLADLRRRDLPPFRAAIAAGTAAVMPGHLLLPELTGDLPASLSAAAMTGLLRGELGFAGVIISDALEMRAVSEPFGIPEAAVMAVTAGADLLCLGRDTSQEVYQAVTAALSDAVRTGRLPGQRLEDAADRVTAMRAWLATAAAGRPVAAPAGDGGRTAGPGGAAGVAGPAGDGGRTAEDGAQVGLSAARRALRLTGPRPVVADPVIIEVVPRENVAVGQAAWGLGPWGRPGSIRRFPASGIAAEALDAAAGRSLVIVVRDAHCSDNTRALLTAVLAERPDAVVVEMGLPMWQPPAGSCQAYLATYGASRANAQAAAEILGLTGPATPGG